MDEELIKKDYLKKIKLIQNYNETYYDKDRPIVTDQEYDLLKKEIIDQEKKYKFLKNKKSPSESVGFKPSKNFKKVKHRIPKITLGFYA